LDFTGTRCERWIVETGFCGADTSVPPNTSLTIRNKAVCIPPNQAAGGVRDNSPAISPATRAPMPCPDLVDWVDNHNNGNRGRRPISSLHPGGAQVGLADGSVRMINNTIDTIVWRGAGTKNGGEQVNLD